MKFLIAPDCFKGSLSAVQVCNTIEKAILGVFCDAKIIKLPVADGGEGTAEAFLMAIGGELVNAEVTGLNGKMVNASFALLPDYTAVMAQASGLLLAEEKNPLKTTTYGTGQLIINALNNGCRKMIIGIGGSATNDGGIGMAQALGYQFKDRNGEELGFGGSELGSVYTIDSTKKDKRLKECEITVACDVTNPLCDPKNGASCIYKPQKGANPEMVALLDHNLEHFSQIIKTELGVDVLNIPGAGAAGGLGGGLIAFCGAKLKRGIDFILDAIDFNHKVQNVDLVITGEGKIDEQSSFGKVIYGVATRAKKYNKPVIAFTGAIGGGTKKINSIGIDAVFSIVNKPLTLDEAICMAEKLLYASIVNSMKLLSIGLTS